MNHLINESFQAAKFSWVDDNQFVTTSWTKNKAKMLKLWDIRKVKEDLSSEGELTSVKIDSSTTVTTPFVDKESKLIYTIAKGEAIIRTYEYSSGNFIKGIDFSSAEPSISTVMFERKCLDYNRLEVDRFARYVNSKKIYYVSYTIPRRNPGYDPSLYPPVDCGEAALSYDDWISGKTAEPIRKEINTIENKFVSNVETFVKQEVKVEKTSDDKIKELERKIAEMSVKVNQLTEENAKLKKLIEDKKGQQNQNQENQEENKIITQEEEPEENEEQGGRIEIQQEKEEQPQEEEEKPQEEVPPPEENQDEQEEEQGGEIRIQEEQQPEENQE